MDNSPRLPTAALVAAAALAVLTVVAYLVRGEARPVLVLSELEIGLAAIGFTLAIFGAQGLISVLLEGRRLQPGIVAPRLTNPLSLAILLLSLALLAIAVWLGFGLVSGWGPTVLGIAAGLGCLVLAIILVVYKEAFVGDEARFDEREDGVPW